MEFTKRDRAIIEATAKELIERNGLKDPFIMIEIHRAVVCGYAACKENNVEVAV
jgi:hypothetical protein